MRRPNVATNSTSVAYGSLNHAIIASRCRFESQFGFRNGNENSAESALTLDRVLTRRASGEGTHSCKRKTAGSTIRPRN
jgi:hypothetical protein